MRSRKEQGRKMVWRQADIDDYLAAVKSLYRIKNEAFAFIAQGNVTEYDVHQFVLGRYRTYGLITDDNKCIAAFGKNTAYVHYFPSQYSQAIKSGMLVMLDIWAKLDKKSAPYADITWMGYYGRRVPSELLRAFRHLTAARDGVIAGIGKKLKEGGLPTGSELDAAARDHIRDKFGGYDIPHTVGHSLGRNNDHGHYAGLNKKNSRPLRLGLGYTIEPGIYFNGRFGMRTELDFYIDRSLKLHIAPKRQTEIELIKQDKPIA